MRAAGPARHAVDGHRARPAHPDAAREPVSERRIELALDVGDHVQHRLALLARHLVFAETAGLSAAPDANPHRVHDCCLGGLVQPRQHEFAVAQRLRGRESPVRRAQHAFEQLVAG